MGQLERVEAIAKIASLIIIPFVIALTGWWVQSSVADAGIRKDYVAMAMGILKDKSSDPELVTWASEVIRENSPTPLSNELQQKIVRSTLEASLAASLLELPPPPAQFMEKPITPPEIPLEGIRAGKIEYHKVLELWIADHGAAKSNAIALDILQKYVRSRLANEQDYRAAVRSKHEKKLIESVTPKN